MPELDVAEELYAYLIDEGLAVALADADGTTPVVVIDPEDGAPIPAGDFVGGTITLTTPVEPLSGDDHSRLRTVVSVVVRAPTHPGCRVVIRGLQSLLTPLDLYGGKKMFEMGQINPVELCIPFRGPQRIGVDQDGYTFELAFEFWVRRKVLAGLSFP